MNDLLILLVTRDFLFGFGAGVAATYLVSIMVVVCLFLHEDED